LLPLRRPTSEKAGEPFHCSRIPIETEAETDPKMIGFEQATKARVLPKHTPALPSDVLGMASARKTP
jgi:hypothetical protein